MGLFQIPDAWSQPFWLPTTGDTQVTSWPSMGVQNTGTAAVGDLQALVWDCDNPGLAVRNFATGQTAVTSFTIDGVYDPDVVINPVLGNMIIVVYTLDPALGIGETVRYEYFEYNASTNTLINHVATTRITSSGTVVESYPNIDISEDGLAYVVWQDTVQNEIYAAVLEHDLSSLPPPLPIINILFPFTGGVYNPLSACYRNGEMLRKPDISTRYNGSTGLKVNTLVYEVIDLANNNSEIVSTRFADNEYFINSAACANIFLLDQVDLRLGHLSDPRVSANSFPLDDFDANVTWAALDLINFLSVEMRSITCYLGSWSAIQSLNQPTVDLTPYPNRRPVTSYGGDLLINAWDYDDTAIPGNVRNVADPLARQLYWWGSLYSFDYSVIPFNRTPPIDYINIAIDGRYSGNYVHYAFYAPSNGQMYVKRSMWTNQSLRQRAPEYEPLQTRATGFKVYPTQLTNEIYVEGSSSVLVITDVHGRKVPFTTSTTEKGFRITGLENWSAGVYLLRAQVGSEIKTVKLIK